MKLVLLMYIMSLFTYCQSLDGVYKSEKGSEILLNGKSYYYHKKIVWKNMPITETISISEGSYFIKQNIILLSSKFDLSEKLNEIFNITQGNDSSSDYIELRFKYYNPEYNIFVCNVLNEFYDEKHKEWTNQTDFCLKLKDTTKIKKKDILGNLYFKIYPNFDFFSMRDFEFRKNYIKSKEFVISLSKNIEINLNPRFNLDLFYFEEFDNEIALIEKDYIFFKGEKFYKVE